MKKSTIKLNEEQLQKLISNSVKKALMEHINEEVGGSDVIKTMSEARKEVIGAWVKLYDLIDEAKANEEMQCHDRLLKADSLFNELDHLLNVW